MKVIPLSLGDAFAIDTHSHEDVRGQFTRVFCQKELDKVHKQKSIQQINFSTTAHKGTIRGLHFQRPPKAEAKMIRCLSGTVFDVIVDLRGGSDTFLRWHGEVLSSDNMRMIYAPEGFAHGFQALDKNVAMLYLHFEMYSPEHEGGLRFDDPRLAIEWPLPVSNISERDSSHSLLASDFEGLTL